MNKEDFTIKDLEDAFNAGRTTNELDMAFFQEMGWKLKYLTFDEYLQSINQIKQ